MFNGQEIESLLASLGAVLQQAGIQQPIRIFVIGGAFMALKIDTLRSTQDVDIVFLDIDDTLASPIVQKFRAAVTTLAAQQQLPVTWMNDLVGDAIKAAGPIPPVTLWRSYPPLEVYVPPDEYILALKIFAGRPKDYADITALCQRLNVATRDEAQQQVDRYLPDRHIQTMNHVVDTLDVLFP